VEIGEALAQAKVTNDDIENQRGFYTNVAWRGSILFFSIQGLSAISEMYEYSLNSYMSVFMNALNSSKKDNILDNRLRNITEKLTQLVYDFTCMGIFESHKLLYSFQMVTMIMDGNGTLNKAELDFFLKGNTSLDAVEAKKPYAWLSDNGWKDLQRLVGLGDAWSGLKDNLLKQGAEWKAFFDEESPEQASMPCGYSEALSKFQQLLVMRVVRPDRSVNAIKNFIMA
jgi:dynein heavy chain